MYLEFILDGGSMVIFLFCLGQRVLNKGIRNVRVKVKGLGPGRMVSVQPSFWLSCMCVKKFEVACKLNIMICMRLKPF